MLCYNNATPYNVRGANDIFHRSFSSLGFGTSFQTSNKNHFIRSTRTAVFAILRCKHGCRLQRLQHESLQRGNEARWHRLSLPRFLRALVDSSERVSTEKLLSPVEMRRRETRVREVPIRRVRDSIVDERLKVFFVVSSFSSFGVPFCSFARVLAHFANGFF